MSGYNFNGLRYTQAIEYGYSVEVYGNGSQRIRRSVGRLQFSIPLEPAPFNENVGNVLTHITNYASNGIAFTLVIPQPQFAIQDLGDSRTIFLDPTNTIPMGSETLPIRSGEDLSGVVEGAYIKINDKGLSVITSVGADSISVYPPIKRDLDSQSGFTFTIEDTPSVLVQYQHSEGAEFVYTPDRLVRIALEVEVV